MSKATIFGYESGKDGLSLDITTNDNNVIFANVKAKTNGNIYNTNLSGNLIASKTYVEGNFEVLGSTLFSGAVTVSSAQHNTNTTEVNADNSQGALLVDGGVGVDKDLNVLGKSYVRNTTESTSKTTGALIVSGGAGISGNTNVGGNLTIDKNIIVSGSATFLGGIGGSQVNLTDTTQSSSTSTGALTVSGGVGIGGKLYAGDIVTVTKNTQSTSASDGALVVSGGVGVAKDLWVGGSIHITDDMFIEGNTIYSNVQNVNVEDRLMTLNKGATDNANGSGIEIELSGSIVGYVKSSADSNSFLVKPPNKTGIVSIRGLGRDSYTIQSESDSVQTIASGGLNITNTLGVTGATTLSSTLGVTGATSLSNTLAVTGATTLSDNVSIASGKTLTVGGATTLSDNVTIASGKSLSVGGTTTLTGAATLSSTLGVTGATTLASTLGVTGATTLSNTLGVTGVASLTNATQSTSVSNGALVVTGGAGIAKNLNVGGTTTITGVATLSDNLIVNGTYGNITNNLNVGGATALSSTLGVTGATTLSSTLGVTGATTLSSTLGVTGVASLTNATQSTSVSNGALVITGGAGIAKNLNVGGATALSSTLGVTGATTLSSTLGVTGAATLSSTLGVTGATTLSDNVTIASGKSLTVGGATTLSSTLGVTGATTLSSTLGVTGATTMTGALTVNNNTTLGSSNSNSLTLVSGSIIATNDSKVVSLKDNVNNAMAFNSTGKGNILNIITTDNYEHVEVSGLINNSKVDSGSSTSRGNVSSTSSFTVNGYCGTIFLDHLVLDEAGENKTITIVNNKITANTNVMVSLENFSDSSGMGVPPITWAKRLADNTGFTLNFAQVFNITSGVIDVKYLLC